MLRLTQVYKEQLLTAEDSQDHPGQYLCEQARNWLLSQIELELEINK